MNLIAVIGVLFLLLDSFIRQKDTLIGVMRRNRELESAFLDQELTCVKATSWRRWENSAPASLTSSTTPRPRRSKQRIS